jgi:hypothetical protein
MRELTASELEFVSGGDDPENEEIIVTGHYPPPPYYPPSYGYYPPSYPPYYGGGGGYPPPPPPTYPPCVEAAPVGYNPQDVLNAAKAAAAEMEAANDENQEYSSFIYSLNGQVYHTTLHTDGHFGDITWTTNDLPAGAHILGMIHNHPDDGTEQRMLSGDDWNAYNTLENAQANGTMPNGITMDTNALMFLYSDSDSGLRAYDKTDKNDTSPSCTIS